MANILVTGGAGFIGSHVADRFVAAGHAVTILDDLSTGKREQVPAGARFVEGDIRSPEAAALLRDGSFDVVAHLAAQIDVRRSVVDPALDASINVVGSLNIIEAACQARPRPRVVFASTGGALYGDFVDPPNAETLPKDPDSPYGVAKLAVEHYLAYYARIQGLQTVALRFGNVYGPRQDPHNEAGVVAIFCGRVLADKPLTIYGDGSQTRDYIYVADVADAFLTAAFASLAPAGPLDTRAFNVGTQVETSVTDLARLLAEVSGRDPVIEHAPKRAGELQRSVLANGKAAEVLGWRPRRTLRDGLTETFAWFAGRAAGAPASAPGGAR